ncbi:MAG: hypothetical protein JXA94_07360, partial [Parachlamydiales bacterium]|nr:hypothetical protein [Parachlamydiales bacterium]
DEFYGSDGIFLTEPLCQSCDHKYDFKSKEIQDLTTFENAFCKYDGKKLPIKIDIILLTKIKNFINNHPEIFNNASYEEIREQTTENRKQISVNEIVLFVGEMDDEREHSPLPIVPIEEEGYDADVE